MPVLARHVQRRRALWPTHVGIDAVAPQQQQIVAIQRSRFDKKTRRFVKEDVSEECARFGPLEACHVEKNKPGGLVFLRFNKCPDAEKAAASLHGRYFAKRMITVSYFDPGLYDQLTSS